MGKITLPLLDTLQIPYVILEPDLKVINKELQKAIKYFKEYKGPYAFIIRRNFFKNYEMEIKGVNNYELTAKEAIHLIMDKIGENQIVVSTTGYISRQLFEYRELKNKDHQKSFYNIGSMGCASSIALSIALTRPEKKVLVFDGDGAAIMQMGAFTTIGKYAPPNFVHIILDNEAHGSTGGQPTNSPNVDFIQIAKGANYRWAVRIKTKEELLKTLESIKNEEVNFSNWFFTAPGRLCQPAG